ncbi:hypothetical protein ACFQHV_12235 [Promicromonospora thailandica]|uniref:hypothetical protein n=1 Tax=Promicromonospora thailandica TaxID=765201 RepID=UPI0020A2FDF0|nr:hypothetical protein [Promicromonospora thailandica]BFF19772.1 hypothetical protein GCM10025730_32930 [Promicromonospora thailandica]
MTVRATGLVAVGALALASLVAPAAPAAAQPVGHVTPIASSQAADDVFVGGSVTVRPVWSEGTNNDPSYYSYYHAAVEGFRPEPASYAYQWLRDGAAVAGATDAWYLSSPADVGRQVSVRVTASRSGIVPGTVTSRAFTVRPRDTIHVDYGLSYVGSRWESNFCYCVSSDGQTAGRPGSGRAAQALIVRPMSQSYVTAPVPSPGDEFPASFWFETTGYVTGRGWQTMTSRSDVYYVGSIGENRRLEAFRIKPGGPDKAFYDVWYRAYVPKFGWLGWARNGETSATTSMGQRIEAVQVKVLPKGTKVSASGTGNAPSYDRGTQAQVSVRPYYRPTGWKAAVPGGSTAGVTSTKQRLNALRVRVDGKYAGGVQVSAKVQGSWRPYVGNNQVAGTYHQAKGTSAYKIRLTGEMAKRYDVYYRVNVAGKGWLGWARNGAAAGAASYKARNTAVQVVLVKKGERALMSAGGKAAYAY